jgi:hypothetical protein
LRFNRAHARARALAICPRTSQYSLAFIVVRGGSCRINMDPPPAKRPRPANEATDATIVSGNPHVSSEQTAPLLTPPSLETWTNGIWRFTRYPSPGGTLAESRGHSGHLVSASAFTFSSAYRESDKYARGLLSLSAAIATHLPSFTLRVYLDSSILPSTLRGRGLGGQAKAWEDCLCQLASQAHVNLVWFEHAHFLAGREDEAGGGGGGGGGGVIGGHYELFGTFARFLPLFQDDVSRLGRGAGSSSSSSSSMSSPQALSSLQNPRLPPWAGPPPNGSIVFSSDVDYGDYASEHAMLHSLQWYAAQLASWSASAQQDREEDSSDKNSTVSSSSLSAFSSSSSTSSSSNSPPPLLRPPPPPTPPNRAHSP